MKDINNNFHVISFLFLIFLLNSCLVENNKDESIIMGEVTEIKFDILKYKGHYCHITRAYISAVISSSQDTIIILKSIINSPGCDLKRNSNLFLKLNDIELPLILISSDTLTTIELNQNEKLPLDFSIQQGTYINFGLNGENNLEELKFAIRNQDNFFRLLNSDSLNFAKIINTSKSKSININATDKTVILYQFDGELIKKRYFSKEEFNEISPPPPSN
ncbi:MAG: hypothetical protein Q4G27_02815 [Flavobacteriaceae bacterium]|nr:hypothetical protein [Flavobacteriaceae bacterium]